MIIAEITTGGVVATLFCTLCVLVYAALTFGPQVDTTWCEETYERNEASVEIAWPEDAP